MYALVFLDDHLYNKVMAEQLPKQQVDALISQFGLEEYRLRTLKYDRNGKKFSATLEEAIAVCGLHMFSGFKAGGLPDAAIGNIIRTMVDAVQ